MACLNLNSICGTLRADSANVMTLGRVAHPPEH